MATQTKSVSGGATTYVITDNAGNTVTVVASNIVVNSNTALTTTYTSVGALQPDGMLPLSTLVQLLATGLVP